MNKPIRILMHIAAAVVFCSTASSYAGDVARPKGVVELFTSQGCNSCPPADRLLDDLAAAGDVIALGFHVDYWDYRGWKDTLGNPENTERQHQYARAFGTQTLYTPQAVINGSVHVSGASRKAVVGSLADLQRAGGLPIGISVTHSGSSVIIDAEAARDGKGSAHLVLVYFDPERPVVIQRGENKGQTITYANAVTDVQAAGMWHGKAARFEFPRSEIDRKGGCAVLLQSMSAEGLPGPILGAAMISRPSI